MSKKKHPITKPPIDAQKLDRRLEKVAANRDLVRIRRWIPGGDSTEGFVVGLGKN